MAVLHGSRDFDRYRSVLPVPDLMDVKYEAKEGKYRNLNLGIVKYHFQAGAGL